MQYLLLIHSDPAAWDRLSPARVEEIMGRYGATNRAMQEAGVIVAAHRLHAPSSATTVRVRGGELLTTDGPFAETREQLGGYFLVEASDLDQAIAIAARIPGARKGTVEIRPLLEIDDLPQSS